MKRLDKYRGVWRSGHIAWDGTSRVIFTYFVAIEVQITIVIVVFLLFFVTPYFLFLLFCEY
jgi:hypothetical protein